MSIEVPTTDGMRMAWAIRVNKHNDEGAQEFDAWLDGVKAQARKDALEEAAAALDMSFYTALPGEIPFTTPRSNEPAYQTGHFLQNHQKNMIQRWLRARS